MTALPLGAGAAIPYRYLTRHVGIFGATGTGKTTTLGALVERAPCSVLVLDAKGDLSSLGTGAGNRILRPIMRVDDLGADLIARALDLSEAQAGALQIALAWAADSGRAVATLADLRSLLNDSLRIDLSGAYGLVSPISVSAVQRSLLRLERSAPWAFGAAAHDPRDTSGIAVYAAAELASVPGLYGAFVAHILDTLYRGLGELGDVAAPGLLVMIDEAHLIFDGATPAIVRRIEQITRLIRSKGVSLIYVTQSPSDLPHVIAGQLATRIQHALRASTPHHQKALRSAAETMPGDVTAQQILSLGTGQAIVSVPNAAGISQPGRMVQIRRCDRPLHAVSLPADRQSAAEPRDRRRGEWQAAADPPAAEPKAPRRRDRRPWYFWPAIIAAVLYGPVIIGAIF